MDALCRRDLFEFIKGIHARQRAVTAVDEDAGGSEDVGNRCAGGVCGVTGERAVAFSNLSGPFLRFGAYPGSEVLLPVCSCCYPWVTHVRNNCAA